MRVVALSEQPGVHRDVSGTVPIAFDDARGCVESREKPHDGDVGPGGYFFGVRWLATAFCRRSLLRLFLPCGHSPAKGPDAAKRVFPVTSNGIGAAGTPRLPILYMPAGTPRLPILYMLAGTPRLPTLYILAGRRAYPGSCLWPRTVRPTKDKNGTTGAIREAGSLAIRAAPEYVFSVYKLSNRR